MNKETQMLRALKVICYAISIDRDGTDYGVELGPGWLEQMKYDLVDRIIENVEPGFDGGVTTDEEVENALVDYERFVDEHRNEIDRRVLKKEKEREENKPFQLR